LVHFIKLKLLKPEEIKFDMKIAECYFGIPYYSKTIDKCNEILNRNDINDSNKDKFHLNSLKLKVKSLLKLKKVKEAKEELDKYVEIVKKNKKEFFEIEKEIKNKMKNMKGEYDFGELYNMSKESFNINVGEYVNKKLEIKFDSYKGISVYTKEKLQKGELLIVSKAIIIASDLKEKEDKKNQYIKYDNLEKEKYKRTGIPLVYKENEDLEEILSSKLIGIIFLVFVPSI
jgi:hypothetical protein